MLKLKKLSCLVLLAIVICSCADNSTNSWTQIVPEETSFVVIPAENATLQSALQSEYIPMLDDVSSAAIQLIAKVDSTTNQSLPLKSILLYPGANQKLQPIWITGVPEGMKDKLKKTYERRFAQNEYDFNGTSILNLQIDNRHIYAAQLGGLLLISESSLGIENSIRAYRGIAPPADIGALEIKPGSIIMNTPALDKWIKQLAQVTYAPAIKNALKGTKPTLLTIEQQTEEQENELRISGTIPLSDESKSPLVNALSSTAKPITLDEYISSKATAFGIFNAAPVELPSESLPDTSEVDAFLLNNTSEYSSLANTLDSELGLAMYTESGFLSTGEHLFIRKLKDTEATRTALEELSTRNLIENVEGTYFVQSYILSRLIGSPMSTFKDFYIKIIGDAAVMSKRKGLAEIVASDRNRRRVISYEQFYKKIEETLPENISGLFVSGPEFKSFLQPFLTSENYVDALISKFNYMALTTVKDEDSQNLSFSLSTFKGDSTDNPYSENWNFSTSGADLSGKPAFGNVGGSYNNEIVFATKTGSVYVLAADGTLVQQYNTGSDVPIGSPVVYDWYRTGENVVLVAAGNKIYGWDESGNPLPKFPFELDEQITTPLTIADINDDKLPDALVATADRKLHALTGRGNNLPGWPVTTNAQITSAPRVDFFQGSLAVIAFSSNAAHAWNAAGNTLPEFPLFANASFVGSPAIFDDHILGNAVDGNLYAIGEDPQFEDSLNVAKSSSNMSAVYVSSSSLAGTPSVDELTIQTGGNTYSEEMILTTSSNGSVFLLSSSGQLRLTKNMGQPSADGESSFITDINNDGSSDIIALANYGRLYAWNVETGERIFDLPTTGISHLNITDLDSDGLKELVAQTQNGVQSWTINQ